MFEGDSDRWTAFSIVEVWRGTDPAENHNPCVVFISEDGREHSGLFGEAKTGLMKTRLVARINASSAAANDAAGHANERVRPCS